MFERIKGYVQRVRRCFKIDHKNIFGHVDLDQLEPEHCYPYSLINGILRNRCLNDPQKTSSYTPFLMLATSQESMEYYADYLNTLNSKFGHPIQVASSSAKLDALDLYRIHTLLENEIVRQAVMATTQNDHLDAASSARVTQALNSRQCLPLKVVKVGRPLWLYLSYFFTNKWSFTVLGLGYAVGSVTWLSFKLLERLFMVNLEFWGKLATSEPFWLYFLSNHLTSTVTSLAIAASAGLMYWSYRMTSKSAIEKLKSSVSTTWDQVLQRKTDADILLIHLITNCQEEDRIEKSELSLFIGGCTPHEAFTRLLSLVHFEFMTKLNSYLQSAGIPAHTASESKVYGNATALGGNSLTQATARPVVLEVPCEQYDQRI